MAERYAHKYIWLRAQGHVIGIKPEDMKDYILRWNKLRLYDYDITFWDWLSEEINENVHGFSILWNEGNPHMSKLPIIL